MKNSTCLHHFFQNSKQKHQIKFHSPICIRVECGSDNPDYLGHFFDGSGGSHPQAKLSGCDPDF